jgi:hypothetical protein
LKLINDDSVTDEVLQIRLEKILKYIADRQGEELADVLANNKFAAGAGICTSSYVSALFSNGKSPFYCKKQWL